MVVHHAKSEDRGTYSLQAENRNGKEKIDLDLIVLDDQDHICDFYQNGNSKCSCQHSYTGKDPWMSALMSQLDTYSGSL